MKSEFVDINLLPRAMRPALGGPTWRRLMVPGMMLIIASLALMLGAAVVKVRNDRALAEQRAQLVTMQQGVRDFSTVSAEVELLQEQVTTLATQSERLKADAERVNRQNPPLAPFLAALTDSLLPRMKITSLVAESPSRYIVRGEAGSSVLVIDYANLLKERPEIRAVTPRSVDQLGGEAPPGTVRWTLEVER